MNVRLPSRPIPTAAAAATTTRLPTKPPTPHHLLQPQRRRPLPPLRSSASTVPQKPHHVTFLTLPNCKLGISRYPDFDYNGEGGSGNGSATSDGSSTPLTDVSFDVGSLQIPPLTSATTRFLGLPLPPFLRIDITPDLLEGFIDAATGKVELEFRAKFWFSVGSIYKAPALVVETKLTTEESKGAVRRGKGERMDGDGRCRLVGVASVDPIGDVFMDSFLGLPTECLAVLNARIGISKSAVV